VDGNTSLVAMTIDLDGTFPGLEHPIVSTERSDEFVGGEILELIPDVLWEGLATLTSRRRVCRRARRFVAPETAVIRGIGSLCLIIDSR
jgi:hypothetical protein